MFALTRICVILFTSVRVLIDSHPPKCEWNNGMRLITKFAFNLISNGNTSERWFHLLATLKFSSAKKVQAGVPQGSIDGSPLFNLFINDFVLFLTDIFLSNYADDNNWYGIGKDRDIIKNLLRIDFRALTEWFFENYMALNQKICHYMWIDRNTKNDKFEFDN